MLCKQFLALFLWCHCYQIILNPLLQLLAIGLNYNNPYTNFGLYVYGTPITAAANKITFAPGQEIALRCNIAEFPNAQFTWYYKRKPKFNEHKQYDKRELNREDDRYMINNNVMIIKSSTLADVGDYYCQVSDSIGLSENEKMISVRPKPYIHDFNLDFSTAKSAVVEVGKSLKLSCNVVDDYFPSEQINLTWHMSKYDENDMSDVTSDEDGIRIEKVNSTRQDLIIDRVTEEHRRFYKCQVTNGVTENSKAIFIRVKNKYTFIWPAVGILFELVILIAAICVVENRKIEPDQAAHDRKAIQM